MTRIILAIPGAIYRMCEFGATVLRCCQGRTCAPRSKRGSHPVTAPPPCGMGQLPGERRRALPPAHSGWGNRESERRRKRVAERSYRKTELVFDSKECPCPFESFLFTVYLADQSVSLTQPLKTMSLSHGSWVPSSVFSVFLMTQYAFRFGLSQTKQNMLARTPRNSLTQRAVIWLLSQRIPIFG